MKKVCLLYAFVLLTFASCNDDDDPKKSKTTPVVTTGVVTSITSTSAAFSGEVTDDGNVEITEIGFVYSSENTVPTVNDEKIVLDEVSDILSVTQEDLNSETIYYVRAYATNSKGIGYGNTLAFITQAPEPTTEGLVAYYTFEDNTNDQVGTHHAVPAAGVTLTYSFINDLNKKAVHFSKANNQYAVIDDAFDYEFKTFCMWVKADVIDDNVMVPFVSDNPAKQFGLAGVHFKKVDGQKVILFNIGGNPVNVPAVDGVWYHVTLVGSAKNYAYYLNGTLIAAGTFSNYLVSSIGSTNTILGASREFDLFYSGSMDNLRIYNRALSAEEIAVIANH